MLYALGRWAYHARAWVLIGWVVLLAVLVGGAGTIGTGTVNTYSFPGTESQDALDALGRTFPQFAGSSAQLVAVAPTTSNVMDPTFSSAVEDSVTAIQGIPQVSAATSPYPSDGSDSSGSGNIAPDKSAVIVPIQLAVTTADVQPSTSDALQAAGQTLQTQLPVGSVVSVGGQLYSQSNPGVGPSEITGLLIALVVLLFTFGAVVAAGMPILTAMIGVGASVSIVLMATRFVTITSVGPLLAVMLGLAVGIDYALFVISRHQDQLRAGMSPEESAPRAVATAGSAVVFAATTVMLALVGLTVARIPFLTVTGIASAVAVVFAALVTLTLIPALLGFAGWRMVGRKHRPGHAKAATPAPPDHAAEATPVDSDPAAAVADPNPAVADEPGAAAQEPAPQEPASNEPASDEPEKPARPGGFHHWVRAVTRWPALTVVAITVLLTIVAVPAMNLRLALSDSGSLPVGSPGRTTYDLIAEHFGPGFNGPLIVTGSVIQSTSPVALVNDIAAEITQMDGVASVPLATPNETGDTAVIQVVPEGAPDSQQTEDLVQALRAQHQHFLDQYAVDLSVTGYTAIGIDVSDRLGQAVLPFGLLVVGLAMVLLAMVFRSIVVPITAALGYALSIAAALGLTSLVFIDGNLAEQLNVAHVGSVISFTPIILMGVLFGLAMDYEVFLVSRMREAYVRHGEPRRAIEEGFVGSARVVTAAAIIMIAVFGGFVGEGEASIQPIAFGLAVGVAIDAFLVRMTLIPAILAWFGRRAWWFPTWLDHALPKVDVEGEGLALEEELADWPSTDPPPAIAAEQVRHKGMPEQAPDLDLVVPAGGVLVVEGATERERSDVLLALTGRLPVVAGRCKVADLVLPPRAATVRLRTAVVRLDPLHDPVPRLLVGLRGDIRVLAVLGADTLVDPSTRAAVRDLLEATMQDAAPSVPLTLLVTCRRTDLVADILPVAAALAVISLAPSVQPQPALGG